MPHWLRAKSHSASEAVPAGVFLQASTLPKAGDGVVELRRLTRAGEFVQYKCLRDVQNRVGVVSLTHTTCYDTQGRSHPQLSRARVLSPLVRSPSHLFHVVNAYYPR